jgi:hypothetical protein
MNKQNMLILFLGFLLFSCTQQIDFEKDYMTKQIVLNSIITPDSLITVKLYSSISINEAYPLCITDAEVLLYENGTLIETLESTYMTKKNIWYPYETTNEYDTTYFYQSIKTKAVTGKEYKLVVNHPRYETLTCRTIIPEPVSFTLRDTSYKYNKGRHNKETSFNFVTEIVEPASTEDYYRIVLYKTGRQKTFMYNSDGNLVESFLEFKDLLSYIDSNDPVFRNEVDDANNFLLGTSYNSYGIFSDRLFNGKNYDLSFNSRNGYSISGIESTDTVFWDSIQDGEYFHFIIELHHLSKDTYLYFKSIDAQQGVDHLPFVEPVQVYSNVDNGVGIFGSYSVSKYEVTFGEFPNEGTE